MKTVVLLIVILVGVFGFQLGLRAALRTSYPLAAVESGSMVPTLNVGDIIVVRGTSNASEIKVGKNPEGDIIVFYHPTNVRRVYWFFKERALIVHRAVDKAYVDGKWRFQTWGDNNPGPDQGSDPLTWVAETEVVGTVVGRIPWLGNISLFMQSDAGMFVILLLFVALVIWTIFFPEEESPKSEEKTSLNKEPS